MHRLNLVSGWRPMVRGSQRLAGGHAAMNQKSEIATAVSWKRWLLRYYESRIVRSEGHCEVSQRTAARDYIGIVVMQTKATLKQNKIK